MIDAAAAREERAQRTYRESTRHLQPEMPALPSELLAWGGSAPPPSVPVRSTFKTLFKQQQLVQKREEERAEAAALESRERSDLYPTSFLWTKLADDNGRDYSAGVDVLLLDDRRTESTLILLAALICLARDAVEVAAGHPVAVRVRVRFR